MDQNSDRITKPELDNEKMEKMKREVKWHKNNKYTRFDPKNKEKLYLAFHKIASNFGAEFVVDNEYQTARNYTDCNGKRIISIPSKALIEWGLEETTKAFCHEVGHIIQQKCFGGTGKKTENRTAVEYAKNETEANDLGNEIYKKFLRDSLESYLGKVLEYKNIKKTDLLKLLGNFDMIEDDRPPAWRMPGESSLWPSKERKSMDLAGRESKFFEIINSRNSG